MDTCAFTFQGSHTNLWYRVLGIKRTWDYLKEAFNREGEGLPDARYYETMGPGPQLFAVIGEKVYYHDNNEWFQYSSATDVVHGTLSLDG